MFNIEEIPSAYTEDYKTLHHDIGLVKRSNGLWDLWFGQDEISKNFKNSSLDIVEGDIVSATEIHSLQVAIIISCLTSWNYLNRTGNPIYTEFGNESYSLLKKNKGTNTKYKIKQFFIDCLNRMRRIYSVESLEVYDVINNPYVYHVVFKVTSVTNTLVDGEFYLNTDSSKNSSVLDLRYNHAYTSVSNPLFIECTLKNEYGSVIEDEIIYIYVKKDSNSEFKFYGISDATDENGKVYITIPPKGLSLTTQIMFVFKGNSLYNPSISKIINIESVAYYIKSRYTYKTIEDENGEDVEVIDKQILYVEDSIGNSKDKFRLGELLSDYVFIENMTLSSNISIGEINEYIKDEHNLLEYDENEKNKLYLIPTNQYIEGTDKVYYDAYSWKNDGSGLVLTFSRSINTGNVQLNTNNENEVHFLIDDGDNGLFEIDFDDGHLYYQIDVFDNEF